jgi:peptidyl-prolyl cis-trans isomerase C
MPIFVGETEITDEEVFREMQYHPAPSMEAARDTAAQALVVREILRQEAARKGLAPEDAGDGGDDDFGLMRLVEQSISVPTATIDVCRHYYDRNPDRFRAADVKGCQVPFEAVEEKIRDYLQARSAREGLRAYVLALAEDTRIAGFDLAASL